MVPGQIGGKGNAVDYRIGDGQERHLPFSVQVDGVTWAHASDLAEARMIAFHLQHLMTGVVCVVDNEAQALVLGWWLLTDARAQ